MLMKDLRIIISENLTKLRKSRNLTQAGLGEKFNYSDKAVSKWENGDTLPDVETLYQLCEFYGVTLDYLTKENDELVDKDIQNQKVQFNSRIAISALIVCAIWMLITTAYVSSTIVFPENDPNFNFWPVFVLGVPLSCFSYLICNRLYFKSRTINFVNLTCIVWGGLASFYLSMAFFNVDSYRKLWPVFLVGVPLQAALTVWYIMRKRK